MKWSLLGWLKLRPPMLKKPPFDPGCFTARLGWDLVFNNVRELIRFWQDTVSSKFRLVTAIHWLLNSPDIKPFWIEMGYLIASLNCFQSKLTNTDQLQRALERVWILKFNYLISSIVRSTSRDIVAFIQNIT